MSSDISKSAPWDFGEKLSICGSEDRSQRSGICCSNPQLKIYKNTRECARSPSLPTGPPSLKDKANDERRVVDLITTSSLSVTDAMPEAPVPVRRRSTKARRRRSPRFDPPALPYHIAALT